MRIEPGIKVVQEFAESGKYSIMPLYCEILSDFTTPIEVVRMLMGASKHCFLLESAKVDETWGRYSFLGLDPIMEITCKDGRMKIGSFQFDTENPSAELRKILNDYKSPVLEDLPPFTGGLVGYFSFDYFGYSEPTARRKIDDTESLKDMDLMLFDKVIAFDHLRQKIILIANIRLNNYRTNYVKTFNELHRIARLFQKKGAIAPFIPGKIMSPFVPLFSKGQFCNMVEKAKEYIREGDVFQIVLSNRLSARFEGSLLNTYRILRTVNPSPYMFFFAGTDVEVAGASPETLVKVQGNEVRTFPLAGTRTRGKNPEEDIRFEKELLSDEKELAEHDMLVDLGRNDLGKICKFGTVRVEQLHSIERFSHVMHIGSTIRGELADDCDAIDAIEAVLPAGTLSGAPKIRAYQLIAELENSRRGIYGGAIGYIGFTGNMDTGIAIRIAYKKNRTVFVRSGAGIVADSVPEREFEECLNKAKATIEALEAAQELE